MLTEYHKTLLQIARDAIAERFSVVGVVNIEEAIGRYPELLEPGAVFVTITQKGQLKGCIGTIEPYRSLLDDIRGSALSAAFKDPRFEPLKSHEIDDIDIEISILSKPQSVDYDSVETLKKKVKPMIDGVILSKGYHRAVFLPQVWEKVSGFDEFFNHLCQKAGLPGTCIYDLPEIEKFTVIKIEE